MSPGKSLDQGVSGEIVTRKMCNVGRFITSFTEFLWRQPKKFLIIFVLIGVPKSRKMKYELKKIIKKMRINDILKNRLKLQNVALEFF